MKQTIIGKRTAETLVPVSASAVIEPGGKITKQGRADRKVTVRAVRPKRQRSNVRWRQRPDRIGLGSAKFCVSWPPADLALLDAEAERVGMNRSQYLAHCFKLASSK